jgi:hypothetical protein
VMRSFVIRLWLVVGCYCATQIDYTKFPDSVFFPFDVTIPDTNA